MNEDSIFPSWLIRAGIVFFIVFIAAMAYFLIRTQRVRFASRFAVGTPVLSFGVNPSRLRPGQNFELLIQADPKNNDFHAFDLMIKYDDNLVEFQNPEDLESNIVSPHRLLRSGNPYLTKVDRTTGSVHIVGVKVGRPFTSLSVLAQVRLRIKDTAQAGKYELFRWGEVKLGDYVKITAVEKQVKNFKIGN